MQSQSPEEIPQSCAAAGPLEAGRHGRARTKGAGGPLPVSPHPPPRGASFTSSVSSANSAPPARPPRCPRLGAGGQAGRPGAHVWHRQDRG